MSSTETEKGNRGIVFELENVAVGARQMVYDVAENVLADKDVELSKALFARYYRDGNIQDLVHNVLEQTGKTRLSEDKLVQDIDEAVRLSLTDTGLKLSDGLSRLFEKAEGRGVAFGALGIFGQEVADKLVGNLGLDNTTIKVVGSESGPRPAMPSESWEELVDGMGVKAPLSMAVTTGAPGHRSSLAAGLQTVVVYDEFTSFNDFGGADIITPELDDNTIDSALELLERA
jgi:hypothetical protein